MDKYTVTRCLCAHRLATNDAPGDQRPSGPAGKEAPRPADMFSASKKTSLSSNTQSLPGKEDRRHGRWIGEASLARKSRLRETEIHGGQHHGLRSPEMFLGGRGWAGTAGVQAPKPSLRYKNTERNQ